MKKILFSLIVLSIAGTCCAQFTGVGTKSPGYTLTVKDSLGASNQIGIAQVSPDGSTAVGTYVDDGVAFLQTHTKHNLNFATNNGGAALTLDTLGNFGVGTEEPTTRLDVNGVANFRSQIKVSGSTGSAGQVLGKNASNLPAWMDASDYKFFSTFDNNFIATTPGGSTNGFTFTVPANVTSILVEAWSGGGGGGTATGGGGGGYMAFQADVIGGSSISITVAPGGASGSLTNAGIAGGTTSLVINGNSYAITGGAGGPSADLTTNFYAVNAPAGGGTFTGTAGIARKVYNILGQPGKVTQITINQVTASEFARNIKFGGGGDVAGSPNTAPEGGYRLLSPTYSLTNFANQGGPKGSGGPADSAGGRAGVGGLVIIHY